MSSKKCVHSKEVICFWPKCGQKNTNANWNEHMSIHLNRKLFNCDQCCKSFITKKRLIAHKRIHLNEKTFVCDITTCGKRFREKRQLVTHKNTVHSKRRPFACDWTDCCKKFKTKIHLQQHNRLHLDVMPYKCDTCGQTFRQINNLNYHLNHGHFQRQYKCDFEGCFASFDYKKSLNSHKCKHSNEKTNTDRNNNNLKEKNYYFLRNRIVKQ